jgi:hypothetical protein
LIGLSASNARDSGTHCEPGLHGRQTTPPIHRYRHRYTPPQRRNTRRSSRRMECGERERAVKRTDTAVVSDQKRHQSRKLWLQVAAAAAAAAKIASNSQRERDCNSHQWVVLAPVPSFEDGIAPSAGRSIGAK